MLYNHSFIDMVLFERVIYTLFLTQGVRRHQPLKSEVAVVEVPCLLLAFSFMVYSKNAKTLCAYEIKQNFQTNSRYL